MYGCPAIEITIGALHACVNGLCWWPAHYTVDIENKVGAAQKCPVYRGTTT
jgi:hypothetical protein